MSRKSDIADLERALPSRSSDIADLSNALEGRDQDLRDLSAALGTEQRDILSLIRALGEGDNALETLGHLSTPSLELLHDAIRAALAHDDALPPGSPPRFGAREFPDWRVQADTLELELTRRGVKPAKINW
jgi:hypothetical protein